MNRGGEGAWLCTCSLDRGAVVQEAGGAVPGEQISARVVEAACSMVADSCALGGTTANAGVLCEHDQPELRGVGQPRDVVDRFVGGDSVVLGEGDEVHASRSQQSRKP